MAQNVQEVENQKAPQKRLIAEIQLTRSIRNNPRYTYFARIFYCRNRGVRAVTPEKLLSYADYIPGRYIAGNGAEVAKEPFKLSWYAATGGDCEEIGSVFVDREQYIDLRINATLLGDYQYAYEVSDGWPESRNRIDYYYLVIFRGNELIGKIRLIPAAQYSDHAFGYCPAYTP